MAIEEHWTSRLHGQGPNREWVYGQVPPRTTTSSSRSTDGATSSRSTPAGSELARRTSTSRLGEMIDLAERLASGTDFIRVDLYHLPDRIVFGELTNYPAGGDSPFHPPEFDAVFGAPWTVPRRYR